jgi:LPXTG-site transpeptidase (sortase) family protein
LAALVIVALAATAAALVLGRRASSESPRVPVSSSPAPPRVRSMASIPWRQMPRPVHIVIPAIGVSARIVPLGLRADRTLEVPKNLVNAGWFTGGPEPGERGAAVVVGHVDSVSRPGVFFRLRDLRHGDVIRIRLLDGTIVRYRAVSAIVVQKTSFPTKRVYAPTPRPTLRLVTCSGALDPSTGSHIENRIVFASLLSDA